MKIFLSTPISCFNNERDLNEYKNEIIKLIFELKKQHTVCSEIERISNKNDYDSPEKSISTDLNAIQNCDVFLMHYPQKVATSALIELGFAIAYNKRIIIVTPQKNILPYLVLGISSANSESLIVESNVIDDSLIQKIVSLI